MWLGLSAREWSSILGVVAFAALTFRFVAHWFEMTLIEWLVTALLMLTIIIAAIGTYHLDRANAPPSGVIGWIILHRILCIVIAVFWSRLIGRDAPLRRLFAHKSGGTP